MVGNTPLRLRCVLEYVAHNHLDMRPAPAALMSFGIDPAGEFGGRFDVVCIADVNDPAKASRASPASSSTLLPEAPASASKRNTTTSGISTVSLVKRTSQTNIFALWSRGPGTLAEIHQGSE
jgi:hypothetical protein